MKIIHSKITVEKVYHNVFIAKTNTEKPLKSELTMKGHTAEIAKEKLQLFLEGKPYSHLDISDHNQTKGLEENGFSFETGV